MDGQPRASAAKRGQIVCCRLSSPISRGDVLEAWFLMDS